MCNTKTVIFIYYENVFSSCIVAIHFLGNNRLILPFTLVVILQITQNEHKPLLFPVSNDRFEKLFVLFVLVSERTNAGDYTRARDCKNYLIITETTPFRYPLLTSDP